MKLSRLLETKLYEAEEYTVDPAQKDFIDEIAQLLFGVDADYVKDTKRSKEPVFYGVSNERSKLKIGNKALRLTFDNSTDSGEFEINSLTPFKLKRGGEEDSKINRLYKKFRIASKEKVKYLAVDDYFILREVYLGSEITEDTVRFVKSLIAILNPEEEEQEEEPQKEPVKEKPKAEPEVEPKKVTKEPDVEKDVE